MTTIAVVSFKGGAGKTTVAANVAAQLGIEERHPVAIDFDPQAGLTAALGLSDAHVTVMDLLRGEPAWAVAGLAHDVNVIAGHLDLAGVEVEAGKRASWGGLLADRLAGADNPGQLVIIDSAPGLGVLPWMALRAARHALIVCPPDFLSVRVLDHVIATVQRAGASVLGIVPTMVSGRATRHEKKALDAMTQAYGAQLLPAIPRRVALQDAALAGEPIQIYDPHSDAAQAFATLTERILNASE